MVTLHIGFFEVVDEPMFNIKRLKLLLFIQFSSCTAIGYKDSWTQFFYYKTLTKRTILAKNKEVYFSKRNLNHFSQLIFSWNAFRSKRGHLSFWAQVRNAKNKQWGSWHKMIDWGAGKQRSYMSKADGFSRNHFVRLEVDKNVLADAFRIKIQSCDGATISDLFGVGVSLSNVHTFRAESSGKAVQSLPSIKINNVPHISQFSLDHEQNDALCSPTSCTMVVNYLTGVPLDPLKFAQGAFDRGLDAYGSWPFNTAHAFERCNGNYAFLIARLPSFSFLHRQLERGLPVVVSIRGPLQGATRPYKGGHFLVVVGWDAVTQSVICHDPGAQKGEPIIRKYPIKSFLQAWERSRRLAYLVKPINNKGIV